MTARLLGPAMIADGWGVLLGGHLYWIENGVATNSRIVTLCETRYLVGEILQGDSRRFGFTVALLETDEEGFSIRERYYWCESHELAMSVAAYLRATAIGLAASQQLVAWLERNSRDLVANR